MQEKESNNKNNLSRFVAIILGLPWIEILPEAWKFARKLLNGLSSEGMYEVLEYESALELYDSKGKSATFKKRKKIRYLQNNIIAIGDYAWGDGKTLVDYKVSPGEPVDQYRLDNKIYNLVSLREVRNKGDMDEFNFRWKIQNGFLKDFGWWTTEINPRFKEIKVSIIFPKKRPPNRLFLIENNVKRTKKLGIDNLLQLPDGRWRITWEMNNPRLYERYILKWEW